MGLLNLLITGMSHLGYNGNRPSFNAETPGSTLHNQSSINDRPDITRTPSILDEDDPNNTSKYRSVGNRKYLDNPPR